MRLLFLSNYYPPTGHGGYEQWCSEVASALTERGHNVTVLTGAARHKNAIIPCQGINVHQRLYLEASPGIWETALGFFFRRKDHQQHNLLVLRELIASVQPDVILVWGMWNVPKSVPATAEQLLPGRVVYYLCDYWLSLPSAYAQYWQTPSGHTMTRWLKTILGKLALRQLARESNPALRLDNPLCVSMGLRDRLAETGVSIGHAKIIYGGTQVDQFINLASTRQWSAIPVQMRALYAGRVTRDKGVHTLIRAMAMLPKSYMARFSVDIMGSGDLQYIEQLRQQVRELCLEETISFLSPVSRSVVPSIMAAHDVLVFPSEWDEPFARTVLEAMAAGLAVVGTTTGGTGEVLKEGETGLTFPVGDAQALAHQLQRLIDEPGLCQRLARQGQRTVQERFTFQRMVDEIDAYLTGAVERTKL